MHININHKVYWGGLLWEREWKELQGIPSEAQARSPLDFNGKAVIGQLGLH
jgi:hypothetical protein